MSLFINFRHRLMASSYVKWELSNFTLLSLILFLSHPSGRIVILEWNKSEIILTIKILHLLPCFLGPVSSAFLVYSFVLLENLFHHLPAAATAAKSLQSCPTLCSPIDGSPPSSPVPGILQARTLEWVAISFSNYLPEKGYIFQLVR